MGTPENTKLCDFTSTKNIDFICTPIAPPAPEINFYEIKPADMDMPFGHPRISIPGPVHYGGGQVQGLED
jgi:hypothetical protein